jgi:hypothetical protein
MRLSISMGGDAAALAHPPAMQDSAVIVHTSHRYNQQFGKEDNPGQFQTHKVPPEALSIFLGQPLIMWNHQETYPVQEQTTKVAPEALTKYAARPVTLWNYYVKYQIKEYLKEKTLEAMPNFISIIIHSNLPSSSKEKSPRYSFVAADIIKYDWDKQKGALFKY